MSIASHTTVPAGHEVRLVGRSIEPFVARMPGGLLVASTGCGGDDQVSEVSSLLEELAAQVKPSPVVMSTAIVQLHELFAPSHPITQEIESAAVIYLQQGSLAGWTDAGLDNITTRLRDLGRRTKVFVCLDPTNDVLRIKPRLDGAGIEIRTAIPDGTIVAEVRRPDGAVLTGLVGTLAAHVLSDAVDSEAPLARSPRLNALVLEVVRSDNERTRRALEDCLKARTAPLALIATQTANGEFGIQPRNWPGKQAFVAYGDERSLHRAARKLGMQVGSYAVAAMPPSKLFSWSASMRMTVMLCAFADRADGTSEAWHVALEVADLRRLAP
jgi:hypothetical protein